MKKVIGIALVLALVATLVFSTVALADDPPDGDPIELQEADGGTAEWTDETAAVGDYSVKLDWPAPYRDADNNYIVPRASVVIDFPDDLTVGGVDSWSYWAKAPKYYTPGLTFYTDTVADGNSDTTISTSLGNNPDNTWILIDETTIGGGSYWGAYVIWGSKPYPSYKFDWSAVQGSYGDAEILKLAIGKGVIGTNQDITVYVDDFTLNGITYSFEPPPPPPPPPAAGAGGCVSTWQHPSLVIQLPSERIVERPNHDWRFFTYDGWGNPTTEDIVYTDGSWQVELKEGTIVLLDQEWHKSTILELDSQGQLVGKYGYDGHITAEEIWFSEPPIITEL